MVKRSKDTGITVSVIVVAGGKGIRMGSPVRKQYLMLDDRPILSHTLQAFTTHELCGHVILVVPSEDLAYCRSEILSKVDHVEKVKMVPGGAERQNSVLCGLEAIADQDSIVLIHDGVRPFVGKNLIHDLIFCAKKKGACIPAISAFDTVKKVDQYGCIQQTVARDGMYLAQTPQAFQYSLIKKAHEMARRKKYLGTDDASLVEQIAHDVFIIDGARNNIKITTHEDLRLAGAILSLSDR